MSDFMNGLQNCAETWLTSNMRTPKRHSYLLPSDDDTQVAGESTGTQSFVIALEDV